MFKLGLLLIAVGTKTQPGEPWGTSVRGSYKESSKGFGLGLSDLREGIRLKSLPKLDAIRKRAFLCLGVLWITQ